MAALSDALDDGGDLESGVLQDQDQFNESIANDPRFKGAIDSYNTFLSELSKRKDHVVTEIPITELSEETSQEILTLQSETQLTKIKKEKLPPEKTETIKIKKTPKRRVSQNSQQKKMGPSSKSSAPSIQPRTKEVPPTKEITPKSFVAGRSNRAESDFGSYAVDTPPPEKKSGQRRPPKKKSTLPSSQKSKEPSIKAPFNAPCEHEELGGNDTEFSRRPGWEVIDKIQGRVVATEPVVSSSIKSLSNDSLADSLDKIFEHSGKLIFTEDRNESKVKTKGFLSEKTAEEKLYLMQYSLHRAKLQRINSNTTKYLSMPLNPAPTIRNISLRAKRPTPIFYASDKHKIERIQKGSQTMFELLSRARIGDSSYGMGPRTSETGHYIGEKARQVILPRILMPDLKNDRVYVKDVFLPSRET
jgi:hypothetical protein